MKIFKYCFVLSLLSILSIGCVPKTMTKAKMFPGMYEEEPNVILILPPMNESTAADAKEYYSTTIQEPLAYKGYYTLPYPITSDIMKMEGIYDTELLKSTPLIKFKEYFGADAVLFTTIKKWDLRYIVLASNLTVSVDCELKSTTTNRSLWKYNGTVVVDLSAGGSGGGLAGLIVKAVATAIKTAITDYVPYARQANYIALNSLPYGKYSSQYNKDQQQQVIIQQDQLAKAAATEQQ